uniref:Putative mating-type protein A2 n=1 Tax=Ogataea thermomethanolica (nom. inval.) TaxID=310468 RepID=A0A6B9D233_9ASCO|nr:putative mating-type protein A2 [Ogataea thermomethanolica (nom. inval.)]
MTGDKTKCSTKYYGHHQNGGGFVKIDETNSIERKARKIVGKPRNRFVITRAVVNGILKRTDAPLDFKSTSKIASIVVWNRRTYHLDRYLSYLELQDNQTSTMAFKSAIRYCSFQNKNHEVVLGSNSYQAYKVQASFIDLNISREAAEYTHQNMPSNKFRFRISHSTSQGEKSKIQSRRVVKRKPAKQNRMHPEMVDCQYTRRFDTPFTCAQIEDVYVGR